MHSDDQGSNIRLQISLEETNSLFGGIFGHKSRNDIGFDLTLRLAGIPENGNSMSQEDRFGLLSILSQARFLASNVNVNSDQFRAGLVALFSNSGAQIGHFAVLDDLLSQAQALSPKQLLSALNLESNLDNIGHAGDLLATHFLSGALEPNLRDSISASAEFLATRALQSGCRFEQVLECYRRKIIDECTDQRVKVGLISVLAETLKVSEDKLGKSQKEVDTTPPISQPSSRSQLPEKSTVASSSYAVDEDVLLAALSESTVSVDSPASEHPDLLPELVEGPPGLNPGDSERTSSKQLPLEDDTLLSILDQPSNDGSSLGEVEESLLLHKLIEGSSNRMADTSEDDELRKLL